MYECGVLCLLLVLLVALDSPTALISPKDDVNPICLTTTETLIAHPTQCAQYYNCSAPAHLYPWEKNLQECHSPQLYNPVTQRCEHYSMVQCGNRTEPLGECEYGIISLCNGGCGGPPCSIYNPSCRNLSDGPNVYEGRPDTPYYVVCVNQRLVYIGLCPSQGKGAPVFDPKLRVCS